LEFDQLWDHPQIDASELLVRFEMPDLGEIRTVGSPVSFSTFKPSARHIPAAIGADTATVLQELGITPDEVAELEARGVVTTGPMSTTAAPHLPVKDSV